MARLSHWQYYTSSFVRIEPTEGIPRGAMIPTVLQRNIRATGEVERDDSPSSRKPLVYLEDLPLRICVNSFKIMYREPGTEYFIYTDKPMTGGEVPPEGEGESSFASAARERLQAVENRRTARFKEKFVMNNAWMKGLNHDQVGKVKTDFTTWMADGVVPNPSTDADASLAAPAVDSEMAE